ncbi:MAG: hypothetical protein ACK4IX_14045, partial [Candidatus Sericytochromatia bacterium]
MDETILKEEKIIENVSLIDDSLNSSVDQNDQLLEQEKNSEDTDTKENDVQVSDNENNFIDSNEDSIIDELNVIEVLDEKIDSEKEENLIPQNISDDTTLTVSENSEDELSSIEETQVSESKDEDVDKLESESLEEIKVSEGSKDESNKEDIEVSNSEDKNIEETESLEQENLDEISKEEFSTEETEKSEDEDLSKTSEVKEEIKDIDSSKSKRQNKVVLKGIKDGLLIILPDDIPWNETINDLAEVLDRDKSFWIGASTSVEVGKHSLDDTQVKRLSEM